MPLEIHPITADDTVDLLEWGHIHYAAFSPWPVGCMWNREPSPESYASLAATRRKNLLSNPNSRVFKCIDTSLNNKLIAVAEWSVQTEEATREQLEKTLVCRPPFPEENRAARESFMQGIFRSRREVLGTQPHVELDVLVTHPDHHRRGAGSLLIQWGVDEMDRLGLIGYLEGSMAGRPLYEKFGFEGVRELVWDSRPYGGTGIDTHIVG
ncbi:acyl-CoA N-acyltransferase [Venturia nashicola]|uniref:Acyl-CoA N-acyltransferase n=1 Tax=Venturia nashicola TaxID=86259 RepID=A0A4Z1P0K7_9PEZI|nr:acyl-CoA N-acyltransferase [Venturia nashicola]